MPDFNDDDVRVGAAALSRMKVTDPTEQLAAAVLDAVASSGGVLDPAHVCLRDDPGNCPHHGRHGDAPTGAPGHCWDVAGQWWHKPGECRLYGEPHDCCQVRLPWKTPPQYTARKRTEPNRLLWQAREALRLTREYVGEEVLPPVEGWSWFDATTAIDEYLARADAMTPQQETDQ